MLPLPSCHGEHEQRLQRTVMSQTSQLHSNFVQVVPGIYPLLVERIIVARPDLLKADVREVRMSEQL